MTNAIVLQGSLGKRYSVNEPKIQTLQNYTHLSDSEFELHIKKKSFTEQSLFLNFDNLKESEKIKLVNSIEQPKDSVLTRLINFFK